MKISRMIVGLAFVSLTLNVFASTESLTRAGNSKTLRKLEASMLQKGYALKSITDLNEGEALIPQCKCEKFNLLFQKSSYLFTDEGVRVEKKEFELEIWDKETDGTIHENIKFDE